MSATEDVAKDDARRIETNAKVSLVKLILL